MIASGSFRMVGWLSSRNMDKPSSREYFLVFHNDVKYTLSTGSKTPSSSSNLNGGEILLKNKNR